MSAADPAHPVPPDLNDGLLIGFVGYATATTADAAASFEDEVLELLAEHGARVVYRGRRAADQADDLPAELHLLWFPDRNAFGSYLTDERRAEIIDRHGAVFTDKHALELTTLEADWLDH